MARYPELRWRETPCVKPPNNPFFPAHGVRPLHVGDGTDFSALVTGHINGAQGSFHHMTGVVSETDNGVIDDYALQLNTQFFTTESCAKLGSSNPGCQGWEQFLYYTFPKSLTAGISIQYWLINFETSSSPKCPPNWNHQKGTFNCWKNSTNGAQVPFEDITSLEKLILNGEAGNSVGNDAVVLAVVGSSAYAVSGDNWFPDLNSEWQAAEFNVVGNCCSSQADFNDGSTIVVRNEVNSGTRAAPTCDGPGGGGFTAETNNLFLTKTPGTWPKVQLPSIVFKETLPSNGKPPKGSPTCVPEGS